MNYTPVALGGVEVRPTGSNLWSAGATGNSRRVVSHPQSSTNVLGFKDSGRFWTAVTMKSTAHGGGGEIESEA